MIRFLGAPRRGAPMRGRHPLGEWGVAMIVLLVCVPQAGAVLEDLGPVDEPAPPGHGYPIWYRDTTGLSLALCLDETAVNADDPVLGGPLCLLDRTELADPGAPVSFPDNFWPEAFWTRVDADMPTNTFIDPISGQFVDGSALLVTALEASFANDPPSPAGDDQISFARIRIRIDNPVAGATLKVTHPFGTTTFTNVPMGQKVVNLTDDVGIPLVVPPEDFTGAPLGAVGPFLRWDGPDFPVHDQFGNAYIGDPNIPHTMTGSPFDTNLFRIEGPVGLGRVNLCADPNLGDDPVDLTDCIETPLFIGSGRIARDTDQDGIPDSTDNCIEIPNGPRDPDAGGNSQRDSDGDGYGNACDTDINNDQITNGLDVGALKAQFLGAGPDADFNGDGIVNGLDVGILKTFFLKPPGPSGCAP